MGTSLSGLTPASTFDALIKVGDNSALTASLKTISDGEGNDSPLKLSTAAVGIGSITNVETEINGKQATLVSGTNIKSINSTSLLGSGDLSVQETLISGTNVKTINSTSLLGSGDVAVQETLVSGTNIKTINSTSLLGSGDISISASAAGSNTQIQFNDSGAFGADSLFNWDNTNKRLGVGETTPTAKVHIKGEGATAATTALLIENSSGLDLFKVEDGGNIVITGFTFQSNIIKPNINGFIGIDHSSNRNFAVIDSGGARTYLKVQSSSTSSFADVSINTNHLVVKKEGNVAVGTSTLDASAKLQIDSTTQGFLPPRMTTTERNAIEATAGLIVYNTTDNNLNYYNGTSWTSF